MRLFRKTAKKGEPRSDRANWGQDDAQPEPTKKKKKERKKRQPMTANAKRFIWGALAVTLSSLIGGAVVPVLVGKWTMQSIGWGVLGFMVVSLCLALCLLDRSPAKKQPGDN